MKQAAKDLLDRYPAMKRNWLYYRVQRFRDSTQSRPDPTRTSHPEILEQLVRDGVAVVENWATPVQVASALSGLEPWFAKLRNGEIPEPSEVPAAEHFYFRLPRANERVEEAGFFYESQFIDEIARAYLSPRAAPYRWEAEWRYERRPLVSAEDIFHFDSWRPIFKAFLYLVDVTEDNAPFTYLRGTHRGGAWSRKRALEFDADGPDGSFGHFFPSEVASLKRRYGFEEVTVTAPAGTLIFGDFRGLHRGSPLLSGERKLLNIVYGIQDWAF
jgi:hypothetical protein